MTKQQINYRDQSFNCCPNCKHVRQEGSLLKCSLLSEEKDCNKIVNDSGICDSYKYWASWQK